MNTFKSLAGSLALSLCAALASQMGAAGTLYEYEYSELNEDLATYISLDNNEVFTFNFNPLEGDAFWFVITEGPIPQNESNGNYAVFISDFSDVWAYQYNGWDYTNYLNTSWQNKPLLQYWEDAITPISGTDGAFNLTLDLTNLNSLIPGGSSTWKGLDFADRIGVWWHTSTNANLVGDDNGIVSYDPRQWKWGLDFADGGTTFREFEDELPPPPSAIPAPASLLLLASGLLLLAWRFRASQRQGEIVLGIHR